MLRNGTHYLLCGMCANFVETVCEFWDVKYPTPILYSTANFFAFCKSGTKLNMHDLAFHVEPIKIQSAILLQNPIIKRRSWDVIAQNNERFEVWTLTRKGICELIMNNMPKYRAILTKSAVLSSSSISCMFSPVIIMFASSTYNMNLTRWFMFGNLLMYIKKSSGLVFNALLWGTPYFVSLSEESGPLMHTHVKLCFVFKVQFMPF